MGYRKGVEWHETRPGWKPWNFGLKNPTPQAGRKLPIPEKHDDIVRLYTEEQWSPNRLADKFLPHLTKSGGYQSIRRILKEKGVKLRTHQEAVTSFFRTVGASRRGPRG